MKDTANWDPNFDESRKGAPRPALLLPQPVGR